MNANGQSCADAFTLPNVENLKNWAGVDATGKVNVDAESSPVIVMRNATEVPSSIVAILNTTLPTTIDNNRPSLTDLQGVIDKIIFIMTYLDHILPISNTGWSTLSAGFYFPLSPF